MGNKENKLKISKILIIIGGVLFAVGLAALITSIVLYKNAYDQWHDAWWNFNADLNDMPTAVFIILSALLTAGGFAILMIGLAPYIGKLSLKRRQEILEYSGEDMTNIGNKMVDISAPVMNKMVDISAPMMNKAVDNVVVPSFRKIKEAIKEDEEKTPQIYCKHCGVQIDEDSKFCKKCGKEQ